MTLFISDLKIFLHNPIAMFSRWAHAVILGIILIHAYSQILILSPVELVKVSTWVMFSLEICNLCDGILGLYNILIWKSEVRIELTSVVDEIAFVIRKFVLMGDKSYFETCKFCYSTPVES